MKRILPLFLPVLAAVLCAAAECSRLDAEAGVRKELLARGVSLGSDETGDAYTVVASAESPFAGGGSADACAVRVACFRVADLRARHQIMNARGMAVKGETSVARGMTGDTKSKTVSTMLETFARRSLPGCEVVACQEGTNRGKYVVALALRWSRALERSELLSTAGAVVPAPDWRASFERRFGEGGRLLPPTGVFVDANGYAHRIGVGFAEPACGDALARSAAIGFAEMFARKNLQLAVYGDTEVRKAASARLTSGGDRSTASAYEALATVSASGTLPPGSRSLFARSIVHPVTRRTVFMSVWGF